MKQARRIFWNAMLLTGAALLMRTVGVAFQVRVSNLAGAETMGLYSLMAGVYGFALTLGTSGIHLGVTRVVAETVSRNRRDRVGAVMKKATLYAAICGTLAALLLLFFAEPIGRLWLRDERTVSSLRLFAISLPLISLSSVFGGYFTAVKRPYCNAATQVLEQGARISITMHLFALVGEKSVERMLCALVFGGVLSEILSFAVELLLFLIDRYRNFPKSRNTQNNGEGRQLLQITLPMAFTAYLRSGLITLQHILIPEGLRKSGRSHAHALAAYGSVHSMALPIILYPSALISSFSGLLIPTLAECRVSDSKKRICYMISRVWALSMLFSVAVAGILICFSSEFADLLYPNTETGKYIRILAPLIPIMYLDTATDAMLKGLGEQLYSMKINILDALISVILVWILVPIYGINGYLITVYISECFNTVCSISRLLCISGVAVRLLKWVYKPLVSIVLSTALIRWLLTSFASGTPLTAATLTMHCLGTLGLYLLLLLLLGSISREDLDWLGTVLLPPDRQPKAH